jgi:predicted 3-demethylubiquinone-9 3-methyltransferase (glyoxalase superfamily)
MTRIVPHLWFDTQAAEAAEFYVALFENSRVLSRTKIADTPSGTTELVVARLAGQEFQLLSAGPQFRFTPAISFLVACASEDEVNRLHVALAQGGSDLMPLGPYPFAERYAWVMDRWGVSWQVMYRSSLGRGPKITPTLMFVGAQCGRCETAIGRYAELFGGAVSYVDRYEAGPGLDKPGTVRHAAFTMAGQGFAAMDSAHPHLFGFNEAVSLLVLCDNQNEIDRLWAALSADPAAEACGWLKDEFGVSWQISSPLLEKLMNVQDPDRKARVTRAMLAMKKLDLAALENA